MFFVTCLFIDCYKREYVWTWKRNPSGLNIYCCKILIFTSQQSLSIAATDHKAQPKRKARTNYISLLKFEVKGNGNRAAERRFGISEKNGKTLKEDGRYHAHCTEVNVHSEENAKVGVNCRTLRAVLNVWVPVQKASRLEVGTIHICLKGKKLLRRWE